MEDQQQAQQTQDISERRYQLLFKATPAMLHSIDAQGRLVHVSDVWLTTLGYARDEVVGRRMVDFLTPASRAYATETVIPELFRTGQCQGIEYQAMRKDGTLIDIVMSSVIQHDSGDLPLHSLTVMEDVTERKRVQRELAAQHERLRVTLHSIGDGVITTDAQGRVEYLNPVAERLTGWTNAAARGRPSETIFRIVRDVTRLPVKSPVRVSLSEDRFVGLADHTILISRDCQEYYIEGSAGPIRNVVADSKQGLIVGARTFPGNPYDSHTLAEQLEQTSILLQDVPGAPASRRRSSTSRFVASTPTSPVELEHRGKSKTLTSQQRRCWFKRQTGYPLFAVLCAAGHNLRWLLRANVRLGIKPSFSAF
ncbi:hypothetical protein LMG28138_06031 [Pararobbsia alpina]|uniref:PAS domain-containing protein n=1 Tax=Pararobbsia alpina TaxID=621374 RepID=A0A6S7BYE3_9BURK|nr:hypothetical protein LMG28138_06031 [Pararobbsia alpina]